MKYLKGALKYIDLIVAVVVAFIIIKLVDNYKDLLNIVVWILQILSPFICAAIIAYILNPIMNIFEKRFKFKRGISLLLTYAIIIAVIIITGVYVIPIIYENILELTKNIPDIASQIQHWYDELMKNDDIKSIVTSKQFMDSFDPAKLIDKSRILLTSSLNVLLSKIFVFTSSFIKWIFGFLLSIYMLADKEKFRDIGKKVVYLIFRQKAGGELLEFLSNINNMICLYIGIKAIDSLIIGILAFIGLSIIGSPYAILLALVVGVTNMIPYLGPGIGMVVSGIVNLFVSPFKALIVFVFLLLLQQFDAWILEPKLVGGKVGLSPFLIILAITIGGSIYGMVGVILSVPVMAVIKIYIDKWTNRSKVEKNN